MAVAVVAAVVTQLVNGLDRPAFTIANFFSFFTIQSNIIGAVAVTIAALATPAARAGVWLSQLRGAATLYMAITGLVFTLLLRDLTAQLQTTIPWVNSLLHYIFPLFMIIDWLLDRSVRPLAFRQGLVFLAYPVAYLAYSLIRGPIVDWYPYPFLDPRINDYPQVVVMSLAVAVIALGLAWLLCWTSRQDLGRTVADADRSLSSR